MSVDNNRDTMVAFIYFVIGLILLCCTPALVVALWRWAL